MITTSYGTVGAKSPSSARIHLLDRIHRYTSSKIINWVVTGLRNKRESDKKAIAAFA